MSSKICLWLVGVVVCVFSSLTTANSIVVPVLYLEQVEEKPPVLSNILPAPDDSGLRGAELGISDNNATGRFLNQRYELVSVISKDAETLLVKAREWKEAGKGVIIANLPTETLLKLRNLPLLQKDVIVFNVGSRDDVLRREQCHSHLLHTIPSRAMLSDALIQFLVAKKWRRWLLLEGDKPEDKAFALALQRSSQRFGGKIVERKTWSFDTDLRRTAQKELPLFTQVKDYDVTLIADEAGDVGEYVLYNTWHPRPVAGTQGLVPVGWHRVVEQWGAVQLQNRFGELANRWMNTEDYAAWVAVRAIGEAVIRTNSTQMNELYRYLLSDQFELAGFKGRTLSFRIWNGQLRQPIPLVHSRALVSQSPQDGFLHPVTDLDTLGFDKTEVRCQFD